MRAIRRSGMRLIFSLLFIWISTQAWTQLGVATLQSQETNARYRILTDRSIYITGEEINFQVFNLSTDSLKELNWSKVYYLELITPQGLSLIQTKIGMDRTGAQGSFNIPVDISSGTYYLKGYTRWMRNFGPERYDFLSVNIINPLKRTVLAEDTTSTPIVKLEKLKTEPDVTGPVLGDLQNSYARRTTVLLSLSSHQDDMPVQCCVSVVPKGSLIGQWESVPSSGKLPVERIREIPETMGISLTGKVQFVESGNPAPYAVVYISLLDEGRDFYCNYADSAGIFYFAFPDQFGATDLFISASHTDPDDLTLFIDQDFCTEPVHLPSYPLKIDSASIDLITGLSVNAQIRDQYRSGQKESEGPEVPHKLFFYGAPSTTLMFDDYIKLPTLEEYFLELTPQVSLRTMKRKKILRVVGEHPDLEFYPPLIMIDGVAVFDVESILAVSPRYIDRMEIVDAPYIKGNVTFGGIINLISRNDDMGFIDLPSSGLMVNYKMVEQANIRNQMHQPDDSRIPDVRNVLYWNPRISLDKNETDPIDFQTGDTPGEYDIVIRGYTANGTYIQKRWSFEVK